MPEFLIYNKRYFHFLVLDFGHWSVCDYVPFRHQIFAPKRVVVVVVIFTLKTVLTSISRTLLFLTLQRKETNFRGHKLTQNKVQKNKIK